MLRHQIPFSVNKNGHAWWKAKPKMEGDNYTATAVNFKQHLRRLNPGLGAV